MNLTTKRGNRTSQISRSVVTHPRETVYRNLLVALCCHVWQ